MSSEEAFLVVQLAIPSKAQSMVRRPDDSSAAPPLIALRKQSNAVATGGRPSILEGASNVYMRRCTVGSPLVGSYSGPYQVLRREQKILSLQIGDRQEWISADRVKPHAGGAPEAAQPPKRGRPLGSSSGV